MDVLRLTPDHETEITAVLADAFRDYPVMRYVLGDRPGYAARLLTLVGFFVASRVMREEPLLGIRDPSGELVAAAILSWTGTTTIPEALERRREAVWAELGAAERARYDQYGQASAGFAVAEPHWHLNMIGVRRPHAGSGLGRRLLEAVQRHAEADARSPGVSLTTEVADNVGLYEHFGFRRTGYARIAAGLETWGMFRAVRGR